MKEGRLQGCFGGCILWQAWSETFSACLMGLNMCKDMARNRRFLVRHRTTELMRSL